MGIDYFSILPREMYPLIFSFLTLKEGKNLLAVSPSVREIALEKLSLNEGFALMCQKGRKGTIERLLGRVESSAKDKDEIWKNAVQNPYPAVLKMLLKDSSGKISSPSINNNEAIRFASAIGNAEAIEQLLNDWRVDPSDVSNAAICLASKNGEAAALKLLINDKRVDPTVNLNAPICYACENGDVEILKKLLEFRKIIDYAAYIAIKAFLYIDVIDRPTAIELLSIIKRADPSDRDNYPVRIASEKGYTEILKLLLKDERVDPSVWDSQIIRIASENGDVEIVKLLLEDGRVDPSSNNNYAIRKASELGYEKIVSLLLKDERVNPSDKDNEALKSVCKKRHVEIVRMLLEDSRIMCPLSLANDLIKRARERKCIEIARLLNVFRMNRNR